MAEFWICFIDCAISISDRCGAWQGAGKDGTQVFGLAAGKEKLPLTELGQMEQFFGKGFGGRNRSRFWTCYISDGC